MQIEMNYTSKYFTEQLNKIFGNYEDVDPGQLSSANANIDYVKRKVTRYQQKKYKFEAMLPFEVSKHITLRNNRYILQVKVTNVSVNKVFPESFQFKCWKP